MNFVKYLVLTLCFGVLCNIACLSAKPLDAEKSYSAEYLNSHGHSKEITRMVKLQEKRIMDKEKKEDNNRFIKFLKNMYYERNFLMPLHDFGENTIKTPEAQ